MDLLDHKVNFQKALADWYARAQRPLPWRTEPSLYRTVVSELMAQQTQIKTMLPYFERWMERFPDFEALSEAPEADVLKHWEGLGYYSRARNLHKLANAYVRANPKPTTRAEWQALPGIGPYTSAAIASISFEVPVAVVDGNVVRILSRVTCDTRSFKSNAEAVRSCTALADDLIPNIRPGDHNQAMMELGATVCLKRKPHCTLCPVSKYCKSYGRDDVESIPNIIRRATERVEIQRAWVRTGETLLLHRIPMDSGQLAGQYELPGLETLECDPPVHHQALAAKTRSITHKRIKEVIFPITLDQKLQISIQSHPELYWIPIHRLDTITLSGPHRRWVNELIENHHAKA